MRKSKRAPQDTSVKLAPKRMFKRIPSLIRTKGRVAGFEALRDMALRDWELLSGRMNPYSALKFALEADRHAMFAEIAQAKTRDTFNYEMWEKFQDYLKGNVDVAPDLQAEGDASPGGLFSPMESDSDNGEDEESEAVSVPDDGGSGEDRPPAVAQR